MPHRHSRSTRRPDDAAGVLPSDLYDYYTVEPDPRPGPARAAGKTWRVTDDWPDRVPITEAEIEVFERWFADLFDQLFGPIGRQDRATGVGRSPSFPRMMLSIDDNDRARHSACLTLAPGRRLPGRETRAP